MNVNDIIQKVTGRKVIGNLAVKSKEWESWYKGKVDGFHSYRLYNGTNSLDIEKKTLAMAKKVCEDWSNLLANEKTKIVIKDNDEVLLNNILKQNNFYVMLNECVEKTFALGNGCIVLGLENFLVGEETREIKADKDTRITIDFVEWNRMKPLYVERDEIVECAFVSENTDSTEIVIHHRDEKNEYIFTKLRINKDNELIEESHINTKSKTKWFFPQKPNIVNNSTFSALGISIYANAIDVLKAIDDTFDAFSTEFILGRIRAFVKSKAYRVVKEEGKTIRTFNPYDDLFYQLPEDDNKDQTYIKYEVPQLRDTSYVNGLNYFLNLLSSKVGFGTERYKFDKGGVATATQIISENSDMARNLRKQENFLKQSLIDMVWAIKYINNNYTLNEKFTDFKYEDINVLFDDSIIEDEATKRARDREEVSAGLMSVKEYRMKHFGKTGEDAEAEKHDEFLYKTIANYSQALREFAITPKEFVKRVYGTEDNEKIEYIEKNLKSANPMELFEEPTLEDDNV